MHPLEKIANKVCVRSQRSVTAHKCVEPCSLKQQ